MKQRTRILVALIALSMVLSLVSCGETVPAESTKTSATDAPATDAPATDAPATDAPATDAPATDAPATDAPATDAPATDAPATDAPATDAPATDAPATDAPATDAPATDAPATDAPATDAPATEAPATDAPATDAPATDAPATDAHATEAPASEYISIPLDPDYLDCFCPSIDIDLGGKEINLLIGTLYDEEWLLVDDGDILGTELFNRLHRIEDNMKVDLNLNFYDSLGIRNDFPEEARKLLESSDPNKTVHLVSTHSEFAGALTLEGRFQDIAKSNFMDFNAPCWPDSLIYNTAIDGHVYYVTGDISPTFIYETYTVVYNKMLLEENKIEDPIALVYSGEWTIDKLISMTSGIYKDLNSNGKVDVGDLTAFNFNDRAHHKSFAYSAGVLTIERDDESGYAWTKDFVGDKMEIIHSKLLDWVRNNDGVTVYDEMPDYGVSFKQGTNIFNAASFGYIKNELIESGIVFGFLPCPKLDASQTEYCSSLGDPVSYWAIPTGVDLDDCSAPILHQLGADAFKFITPSIVRKLFNQVVYSVKGGDDVCNMFNLIKRSVVLDAAQVYSKALNYNGIIDLAHTSEWCLQFNSFKLKEMRIMLENLVETLRALEGTTDESTNPVVTE